MHVLIHAQCVVSLAHLVRMFTSVYEKDRIILLRANRHAFGLSRRFRMESPSRSTNPLVPELPQAICEVTITLRV
jgi:hypothetical protein